MTKLDACSMADQDEFSRQNHGVMKPYFTMLFRLLPKKYSSVWVCTLMSDDSG
jgi:hypothetical protein